MKKYRAKLNDRVVGPLSESDIRNLLKNEKVTLSSEIQYFPNGEWKCLDEFSEFKDNNDATFIKKLDDFTFEEEVEEKVDEEFPKEFEFNNSEEVTVSSDKTVVSKKIVNNTEYDKTEINLETVKYLEELKRKEEIEEKAQVDKEEEKVEEKIDLNNDSTQMVNLDDFKNDLADEVITNEISLEKERKETKKVNPEKEIIEEKVDKKLKENPKKKRLVYIILTVIFLFIFLDSEEEIKTNNRITVLNPIIKFPNQFETENQIQAQNFLKEGLSLLEQGTYITKAKAAVKFRISTEHQFKNNSAMHHLIRVYSELLENSNTPIEDSSKIFKLVQINKSKALNDPDFAEAVASFYLFSNKTFAAQNVIEKFNTIKKNKPTINLFSLYLDILRINNQISKANKLVKKLESVNNKNFRTRLSLLKYYNFVGDTKKYKTELTNTYKIYKNSVELLLMSVEILIEDQKFDVVPNLLERIKKLEAERSRKFYSKYLEYRGIYSVYKKEIKSASGYFKKALKLNESSELRSRLASLELSGDPIADVLISESKAIEFIERSKKHLKNKNVKAAFKDALSATNVAENFIPAKLNLARLQIRSGLFKEAISSLENLQKKNITDPEITFILIEAYTKSYKFSDVKRILSIISTSSLVNDYRYYTSMAMYYVYKDDFYNSINWLQLAIRKNPLDEQMHFELTKILIRYRKYNKAKVFLSKLIDINPVELKYRVAYSNVLYETDGITYAVGYLYDILRDYPNNSELLSAIGIYYYKSGQQKKYENIKKDLEKLPKRDPTIYKFLIESAKLDNDDKKLIKNSKALTQIEPGNLENRILLGKTLLNNEKFEESLKEFKYVESRLDSYPRLQYFMSKLYLLTENIDKSIELAQKEIKTNPQNIEGYVLLGDIYRKQKKYLDAEEKYKKAQKINDKNIDTLIGLSSINIKKSQFDIAIDLLIKARSVDPNRSDVHKLLGDAYRQIGQSALATESYKIFLELSPNSRYKDQIKSYLRLMQ